MAPYAMCSHVVGGSSGAECDQSCRHRGCGRLHQSCGCVRLAKGAEPVSPHSTLAPAEGCGAWGADVLFGALAAQLRPSWRTCLALAEEAPPSPVLRNCAVSACAWHWALHLSKAIAVGGPPNVITYSAAISACDTAGEWQPAAVLFIRLGEALLRPTGITLNAGISAAAHCGWQDSLKLLQRAEVQGLVDLVGYNASISACEKNQEWRYALALLARVQEARLAANLITCNSCISACEKCSQWERAMLLLHELPNPDVISFNAAISASGNRGLWQHALHLLALLAQRHLWPDVVTYNAAISSCERSGQWPLALLLLEDAEEAGESSVISYNATISACESGGQWQHATLLLRGLEERRWVDLVSYCTSVSACGKAQQWQQAVSCLQRLKTRGLRLGLRGLAVAAPWRQSCGLLHTAQASKLSPDTAMYVEATTSCEQGGLVVLPHLLELTQQQAIEAVAKGRPSQPARCGHDGYRIDATWDGPMSAEYRQHCEALHFLSELQLCRLEAQLWSLQSCTSTMGSCQKQSRWPYALLLLRAWSKADLDAVAYSTGVASGGRWRNALQILEYKRQSQTGEVMVYNSAISACEKKGKWTAALALLQKLQDEERPDVISHNAALSAVGRSGLWRKAALHLAGLSLQADIITFDAAMTACEKGGRWRQAVQHLGELQCRALRPQTITFNVAISAQPWAWGALLLERLEVLALRRSIITYNAATAGPWRSALWIQQLQRRQVQSNVVGCCASISACEKEGQWQFALLLLAELGASRMQANLIVFNAAISACAKSSQWQMALSLFQRLTPDALSFSAVLGALCGGSEWRRALLQLDSSLCCLEAASTLPLRWRQALLLTAELRERLGRPSLLASAVLLGACAHAEAWQRALHSGIAGNAITSNAVIAACTKAGRWHRALVLFEATEAPDATTFQDAANACETGGATALGALLGRLQRLALAALQVPSSSR
ncbi:unnamed protein product [Effrenium voratum]|nr:unnamed protein product [Effrenium voratum]